MKKFISIFVLFISAVNIAYACQCPVINKMSKQESQRYDVIFLGKVDSVSACSDKGAVAYFTIEALYKGSVQQHIKLNYDCNSPCLMSFAKDEKWLMFTKFERFDLLTINICSHSRKYFEDASKDVYTVEAGMSFEDEKKIVGKRTGYSTFC